MEVYKLQSQNGKVLYEGSFTGAMKELMKIAKETGSFPFVTYEDKSRATCFEFEGNYCNFKVYIYS